MGGIDKIDGLGDEEVMGIALGMVHEAIITIFTANEDIKTGIEAWSGTFGSTFCK